VSTKENAEEDDSDEDNNPRKEREMNTIAREKSAQNPNRHYTSATASIL
jgi:hypothetical protein